jgi:hypothetical protein
MPKTKTKKNNLLKPIRRLFDHKHEPLLHTIEWVFVLVAFFAIGFPVIFYQSAQNIFEEGKLHFIGNKEALNPPTAAEKKFIGETVAEPVDTTGWDTYRNQWYGFEIQHPTSWTNMQYRTSNEKSGRYDTIYKFRKDSGGENDAYVGFDVVIYQTRKINGLENTNNIQKKEDIPEDTSSCQFSQELTLGEENIKFQKVNIQEDNACYEPVHFFSVTKGSYLYNIIPIAKDGADPASDPEKEINKNFPEYKEVVASLKFIPISRPVVVAPKPRITAQRPVSAKVVGGRLVCAIKNDHPHKSNKNKPGHLDLECCLDPDERPNPWCSY